VLKYVVNESVWPSLWMGVANVIANALVMLRYVLVESSRVQVRLSSSMLTLYSSVILWVSQNMEDDYTYNLAL